ncbi:MAG: FAD-linked oxidase [Conexibacter sp.]|nr:FAD-linked oxidase [Conexibacter sp.]
MPSRLSGWGRYPQMMGETDVPRSLSECRAAIVRAGSAHQTLIPRGMGRSYGDSALAARVLDTRLLTHLHRFDPGSGMLECAAGVALSDVLAVFVVRGWFLPVTPGTAYVTIGGAIASDVHGKNHHGAGTFGQHVTSITLLLGNGELVTCSREHEAELFRATCGGMGLTGVIVSAAIRLIPIRSSEIVQTSLKAGSLQETLELFETSRSATYSVAWIDCLSSRSKLGRSVLMVGEHAENGALAAAVKQPLGLPLGLASGLLNRRSAEVFNALYYHRRLRRVASCRLPLESYFYPLDALRAWNRLYGEAGLVQYQFVLPKAAGPAGLREILERIAASGKGAFLAVLKLFGPGNDHLLSFPLEGYTLALDFKRDAGVLDLLDVLDRMVLAHGGRLYLAKDARMSQATFRQSYTRWQEFEHTRERYHAIGKFASAQSIRLGLR